MDWEKLPGGRKYAATGHDWGYLTVLSATITGDVTAVVLTRWPASFALRDDLTIAMVAANTAVNTIRFPFGRGSGRPGGLTDAEIEAMFALAQGYAERYEAGEDLTGYPEWTYRRPYPGFPERYPSGADSQLTADGELEGNVKFLASGDANDCRHC